MRRLIPEGGIDCHAQVRILADNEEQERYLAQILEKYFWTLPYHNPEQFFIDNGSVLPACAVVEWQTGGHDGLEIAARCREHWPHTAIVLIWEHATVPFTVSAMRKGVDSVLEKPIQPQDLIHDVQASIEWSQSRCNKNYDSAEACQRLKKLSQLELEILKQIADGVPNKNIAATLTISLRTVEKYRHSLFDALGVNSAAGATKIWVLANLDL